MGKPVILAVDDDPPVLRAVERDLRSRFGEEYRIVRADSGAVALDVVKQLQDRNEPIALFLVDQRMPRMSGVEFLQEARPLFPEARAALLTAYADTEAAIKAINSVRIDYYLMKPWDPPQEKLYPVIEDLLADWKANFHPPFEGVRVVGHRWSPDSHRIKDFLARNQVPYHWVDVEAKSADMATQRLLDSLGPDTCLPFLLFADGGCMDNPTNAQIAEKVGLHTQATHPFYDLVIVGGGPAGLAAAVYGASEGLCTLLIEREAPGGQAGMSSRIENYLGFPSGLSGADLSRRAVDQARRFQVELLSPQEVTSIRVENTYRILTLSNGAEVSCHAVILAMGVSYRKLDVPGMELLTGAGVYYGAAMTEALSCQDETVYLVGGANSAGQAAMYFSKYARQVTMLVRGDSLSRSMSQYLIDEIKQTPNIEVLTCTQLVAVEGRTNLERVRIQNTQTGEIQTCPASSVFILIGAEPHTDWLEGVVERDEKGFLRAGPDLKSDGKLSASWSLEREPYLMETSVPGIFAVGDVRLGTVKRVASAVGQGAIAISFVHEYLSTFR